MFIPYGRLLLFISHTTFFPQKIVTDVSSIIVLLPILIGDKCIFQLYEKSLNDILSSLISFIYFRDCLRHFSLLLISSTESMTLLVESVLSSADRICI